jgi:hypothetical protein
MINFKIENGAISEQSKKDVGAAFKIDDGEYLLFIYKKDSATVEIEKITVWFAALPIDFSDVDQLQKNLNLLCFYQWRFANEVGASAFDKTRARMRADVGYAKLKNDLRNNGTGATEAQSIAKERNESAYLEEANAEAYDDLIKAQNTALNNIIKAMSQHIATIKKEREYSGRAANPDFPHTK